MYFDLGNVQGKRYDPSTSSGMSSLHKFFNILFDKFEGGASSALSVSDSHKF
jgi:hypothetical protein